MHPFEAAQESNEGFAPMCPPRGVVGLAPDLRDIESLSASNRDMDAQSLSVPKLGWSFAELLAVFTRLGGTAAMAEWAKRNKTDFYRLYARLIPPEASITDLTFRDASELSTAQLQAIVSGAHGQAAEAIKQAVSDDEPGELH